MASAIYSCVGSVIVGMRDVALSVAVILVLVAGEENASVSRGNAAYARGDDQAALLEYQRAKLLTDDPGLVAFNQAAALYRLGRVSEAAHAYRCCLQDAVGLRRFRASYGLATCLTRLAMEGQSDGLQEAIRLFDGCLDQAAEELLLPSVRHNRELALGLRDTPPVQPRPGSGTQEDQPAKTGAEIPGAEKGLSKNAAKAEPRRKPASVGEPYSNGELPLPGRGNLPPVSDSDRLEDLGEAAAKAHLVEQARRISTERRLERLGQTMGASQRLDW